MGNFLNEYVKELQTLIPLVGSAVLVLFIFSILYNRWMSDLGKKKDGYTAILVAVGNLVNILVVAAFSWKAALIVLIAFVVSGIAMIIGDVQRAIIRREEVISEAKKGTRRKPLPYLPKRLMEDAYEELTVAEHKLGQVIAEKKYELIPIIAISISKSLRWIFEAKSIEGE